MTFIFSFNEFLCCNIICMWIKRWMYWKSRKNTFFTQSGFLFSLLICGELAWHLQSALNTHTHTHTLTHSHTRAVRLAACGTLQLSTTPHFTHLAWWRAGFQFLAHLASCSLLSGGFCLISYPASAGHSVVSLRSCLCCDFKRKKMLQFQKCLCYRAKTKRCTNATWCCWWGTSWGWLCFVSVFKDANSPWGLNQACEEEN